MAKKTLDLDVRMSGLQAATRQINETARAADKLRDTAKGRAVSNRLAQLAREERLERLRQLPIEDQIARAEAKRLQISRAIERSAGNELRSGQLRLALSRQERSLTALRATQRTGLSQSITSGISALPFGGTALGMAGRFGLPGLIAGGAAYGLNKAARGAQGITDRASALQIDERQLQGLEYAAKSVGDNPERLLKVFQDVRKNQGDALKGNRELINSFQRLGFTAQDLQQLQPDQLFLRITDRLRDGNIGAAEFNSLLKVAGETSREMLPTLKKDISGMVEEFDRLNLAVGDLTRETLTEFGDAWDRDLTKLGARFKKFGSDLAADALEIGNIGRLFVQSFFSESSGTAFAEAAANYGARRNLENDPEFIEGQRRIVEQRRRLEQNRARNAAAATGAGTTDTKSIERLSALLDEVRRKEQGRVETSRDLNRLNREREDIERRIANSLVKNDLFDVAAARNDLLNVQAGLQGLANSARSGLAGDQFARQGLFTGGGVNEATNQLKRITAAMDEANRLAREANLIFRGAFE